jgi:outer membrane protein assembly factor BamB
MVHTESGYDGAGWGDVFALNATSGAVIWDYRDSSSYGAIGPSPAVADGIVVFGFDLSDIGALNASDGASLWNYTAAEGRFSSPTVVGGVVYIGLAVPSASVVLDGTGILPFNLFALNATNGDKIWSYNFTEYSYCYSSPAVVKGVVYVGSGGAGPDAGGNVYALNASSGAELWSYPISWTPKYSDSWVDSSPAVVNGVVYVGCDNGNVYALNAANGKKLWNYTTGGSVDSSPAVANGIVYVGSGDGNLYALDAENGAKLWNFTSGGPVDSSPTLIGGVVYLWQDYIGVLYSLNAYNGEKLSNYTIYASYSANGASPVVANGEVYIGSQDGQVYALSGSSIAIIAPNTLAITIVGIVAVAIVVTVVLILRRRLKTKLGSQRPKCGNSEKT